MIYEELKSYIKIESKRSIKSFIGINITQNWSQHLIALDQDVDHLIAEFQLNNAHTTSIPLNKSLSLLMTVPSEKICNPEYYQ